MYEFSLNINRNEPNVGVATIYALTGNRFVVDYNGYVKFNRIPEYWITTIFLHFKEDNVKIELEWIDTRPTLYTTLDRYIPNVVADYMKNYYPNYDTSDSSGNKWSCLVMIRKVSKKEREVWSSEGIEFSPTPLLQDEDPEIWNFNYMLPESTENCIVLNQIPNLSWLTKKKKRK